MAITMRLKIVLIVVLIKLLFQRMLNMPTFFFKVCFRYHPLIHIIFLTTPNK